MYERTSKIIMGQTVLKQNTILYKKADEQSESIAMLNNGEIVKLGKVLKRRGKTWVGVKVLDGRNGYILGTTKTFTSQRGTLLQDKVDIYDTPSEGGSIKATLVKNAKFMLIDSVDNWVRVRGASGIDGYIPGQTKVKRELYVTKEMGKKNMIYGALWCIGGIIFTVVSYSAASSSGGEYYITWGAIIFGAIQFFNGLGQYNSAEKDEKIL